VRYSPSPAYCHERERSEQEANTPLGCSRPGILKSKDPKGGGATGLPASKLRMREGLFPGGVPPAPTASPGERLDRRQFCDLLHIGEGGETLS
jgi:hypothetical protein